MRNSLVTDYNVDPIAQKFVNNIYGSGKGNIRKKIVWCKLLDCINFLKKSKLIALDAGGVFGYFIQKLAALGSQVVLCDISKARY